MKCAIFTEKREEQNKSRKNKLRIWEKFKKRPKKIWLFSKKYKNWVWHYWKVTANQSAPILIERNFDPITTTILTTTTKQPITTEKPTPITDPIQAVGALGELSDKSDFSLLAWDSFSQEIRDLLLFYCQKSLNLFQMQWFSS